MLGENSNYNWLRKTTVFLIFTIAFYSSFYMVWWHTWSKSINRKDKMRGCVRRIQHLRQRCDPRSINLLNRLRSGNGGPSNPSLSPSLTLKCSNGQWTRRGRLEPLMTYSHSRDMIRGSPNSLAISQLVTLKRGSNNSNAKSHFANGRIPFAV